LEVLEQNGSKTPPLFPKLQTKKMADEAITMNDLVASANDDGLCSVNCNESPPMTAANRTVAFDDDGTFLEDEGTTTLTFEIDSRAAFLSRLCVNVACPAVETVWKRRHFLTDSRKCAGECQRALFYMDSSMGRIRYDDSVPSLISRYVPVPIRSLVRKATLIQNLGQPSEAELSVLGAQDLACLRAVGDRGTSVDGPSSMVLPFFPDKFPIHLFIRHNTLSVRVEFNNWRAAFGSSLATGKQGYPLETVVVPADPSVHIASWDPICGPDFAVSLTLTEEDFVRRGDRAAFQEAVLAQAVPTSPLLTGTGSHVTDCDTDGLSGGALAIGALSTAHPMRAVWADTGSPGSAFQQMALSVTLPPDDDDGHDGSDSANDDVNDDIVGFEMTSTHGTLGIIDFGPNEKAAFPLNRLQESVVAVVAHTNTSLKSCQMGQICWTRVPLQTRTRKKKKKTTNKAKMSH
jgi:hypothetical protein